MKLLVLLLALTAVLALDNGLALKPPMGWLSWEWFRCEVDCKKHPNACIDENLFVTTIDSMASKFVKYGYKQVNIDDCWMSMERDSNGYLTANATRFPHGIKWLSSYAHNKGIELGIYEDFGDFTCQHYPGSKGYIDKDAEIFGKWEVDSLKLDGCYSKVEEMHDGYTNMSKALNRTGRPILYACSWPAYEEEAPFPYLSEICNLWRPYDDIEHTWASVSDIIRQWGDQQTRYAPANAPGHWVDPDMLVIGSPGAGLGVNEYKTQFALWAMFAAPMYMSHDVRNTSDDAYAILTNEDIIAIDQDPLGSAGRLHFRNEEYEVWGRPLDNGDFAAAVFNKANNAKTLKFDPHDIGVKVKNTIVLRDLELHKDVATLKAGQTFTINDRMIVSRSSPRSARSCHGHLPHPSDLIAEDCSPVFSKTDGGEGLLCEAASGFLWFPRFPLSSVLVFFLQKGESS